jgi:Multiubiquitin
MDNQPITDVEIDIFEFAERRAEVPHAHRYKLRIDCEEIRVDTPTPTGEMLLAKVHRKPCAYELIAEYVHCDNEVIEPHETVDLCKHGLKGFITAHREVVTIFIGGPEHPYQIERGERTVAQILGKVDKTPEGYVLLEEKDGPPLPVPPTVPVKITGCEMFFTQPQTGGSS